MQIVIYIYIFIVTEEEFCIRCIFYYFNMFSFLKIIKNGTPPTLIVVEITIEALIGKLIFDKTSIEGQFNDPIQNIFGSFNDKSKNANYKASNCLFEFRNGLNMSNIATLFKISNIDISGGIISNRSALQSTQLNLSWFLIKLYEQANKEWLNMNLIYPFIKSSSNLVLSTKVNKKVYDQIKHEEFKNTYPFNYTPDSRGDLTIMSDNDFEFQRKINNYMECNAKYTWDILIKEMNKYLPVLIKNMEEKIQEKTNQIEKISIEIKIKQKKNKFASQSKEIEKEKLEIENLKNDLNHFKEWQSNKDNWHFYHLDTIQKIHDKIVWSRRFSDSTIPKTKKVWPRKHNKKIEYAPLSVRKYSTSSRNTYLKEISKVGFLCLFNQRIHLDRFNYL